MFDKFLGVIACFMIYGMFNLFFTSSQVQLENKFTQHDHNLAVIKMNLVKTLASIKAGDELEYKNAQKYAKWKKEVALSDLKMLAIQKKTDEILAAFEEEFKDFR